MKTIITAIFSLLLSIASSAQIIAAEGFFDTDPGVGNGIPLTVTPNGSVTDFSSNMASGVSSGIHTLFVRTCASSYLWSVPRGRAVIVDQQPFLPPQVIEIDKCEYFIGTDPGVGNGTDVPITLNASEASITENILINLTPGFYYISLRFRSTEMVWSVPKTRAFYVRNEDNEQIADEIVEAEYFIGNTDPGPGNGSQLPIASIGDPVSFATSAATNLQPGIHSLNIRFKSSVGLWSVVRPRYFNVIDEEGSMLAEEIVAAEYFVDADPGVGQGTSFDLSNVGQSVEFAHAALMSAGMGTHTLYVRTKSDRNIWSVPRGRAFIVTDDPLYPVNEIVYAEYYFDTDPGEGNGIAMAIVEGSIVPLDGTIPTTGLNPGQHTLYVRVRSNMDIWSEIASETFIITSDQPFFDITPESPTCSDTDDGQITVEVFGGSPPYVYTWDDVVGDETLSNVADGDYHLVVTDTDNEVVLDTVIVVVAPSPLTFELVETDALCFGDNNGSAEVSASGGTGDAIVDWNGVNPTQLTAGNYDFSVTDENGCATNGTAIISQPAAINATNTVVPTTTSTSCDGSITVDPAGGTPPYSYDWTPDAPDAEQITDLCNGTYSVIITDANDCAYEVSGVLISVGVASLPQNEVDIMISPNPGNGLFLVTMNSSKTVDVSWNVLDAQGKVIATSSKNTSVTGENKMTVDLTAFANGVYYLQMMIDHQAMTHSLIIEK